MIRQEKNMSKALLQARKIELDEKQHDICLMQNEISRIKQDFSKLTKQKDQISLKTNCLQVS